MARQSSNERDSVPHDFYSAKSDLGDKLKGLLASLDLQQLGAALESLDPQQLRAALKVLAERDAATQAKVLAGVDPAMGDALKLILDAINSQ